MKFFREPLIHFLLIGAALFGLSQWLHPKQEAEVETGKKVITIDSTVIRRLTSNFLQHNDSLPTAAQLQDLIHQYINTEVLYREALKTGLDKDNDSLKALLATEMSIVYQADATPEITPERLDSFYQQHKTAYANENNLPDTSLVLYQLMKPRLKNLLSKAYKERLTQQRLAVLKANYQIIRKDSLR